MKKQFLVLLAASAMLVAGCNSAQEKTSGSGSASGSQSDSGSQSSSEQTGANWSADVQEDMMTYLGEVLPYIAFDEVSLYSEYSNSYEAFGLGLYLIGDTNETNLFETVDYGALLVGAGFTLTKDEEYGDSYDKELADGGYLSVTFDYYEATDEYEAGHEIQVSCPIYVEPVTEESLIEQGYVKQTGWPTQLVADTLEGSGLTIPGVNLEGEWYVYSGEYEGEEEGEYYLGVSLATQGDFVSAFVEGLPEALVYDEEYDDYYDEVSTVDVYVSLNNGFTLIDIYGPTLTEEPQTPTDIDVAEEETVGDKLVVTFDLSKIAGYADGTSFNNVTLESTNASLTFVKGEGASEPVYYSSNGVRSYFGNSLAIESSASYTIDKVLVNDIARNASKNVTTEFLAASAGTLEVTETSATISDVAASSVNLSITNKVGTKTGGYLVYSEVVVELVAK